MLFVCEQMTFFSGLFFLCSRVTSSRSRVAVTGPSASVETKGVRSLRRDHICLSPFESFGTERTARRDGHGEPPR